MTHKYAHVQTYLHPQVDPNRDTLHYLGPTPVPSNVPE